MKLVSRGAVNALFLVRVQVVEPGKQVTELQKTKWKLAKLIANNFTEQEVKLLREYMDEFDIYYVLNSALAEQEKDNVPQL